MAVMLSFLFVESANEKGSHDSVGDARIVPPSSCICDGSRDNAVILQFLVASEAGEHLYLNNKKSLSGFTYSFHPKKVDGHSPFPFIIMINFLHVQ